ncbi:MAG: sulfatase-like hydrolase/transferase [Myxococcota bacterium]
MRFTLLLVTLFACNRRDVNDDPLPTDPTLPQVGGTALKFYGRVPKNLLFISIDTFRKDHLTRYGGDHYTPFIDSIAAKGVTLDQHIQCANWTFASTTCTLAGRYNIERGHIPRLNGTDENRPKVPEGTPFLATWLGQHDFYSVIVSGNDWLSSNWGNTQGYDESLRPPGSASTVWDTGSRAIREAIDRREADRWFLHLHFMEPHASYDPPSENIIGEENVEPWPEDLTNRDTHYAWRDEWPSLDPSDQDLLEANLRLLYQGEIRTIDQRLADIWTEMEREGYLDDTLVVFWNDHGEQFWEHDHQTHAYSLNNEENDAFAIFWSRNIVPTHYAGPTASIDLVPSVLQVFGFAQPPEVTGWPVGDAPDDRPRFAESLARLGGINAVQRDGLLLQYFWSGGLSFYDRNVDPNEQNNLYDPEDPRVLELWDLLKPMAVAMAPLIVGGAPQPIWPTDLP